jgi:hypothetical protein
LENENVKGNSGPNPENVEISGLTDKRTTKQILVYEIEDIPNYGKGRFVKIFGDNTNIDDVEKFKQTIDNMLGTVVYQNFIDALVLGDALYLGA